MALFVIAPLWLLFICLRIMQVRRGWQETYQKRSIADDIIGIGIVGLVLFPFVAVSVLGIFVLLLVGIYSSLEGNNTLRICFLIIILIGLIVMSVGAWRILIYDPPLEKMKRKRKAKEKTESLVNPESHL